MFFTTLEVRLYARNLFEVNREAQPYVNDVDLVVKCTRDATDDFIQWAHDKCFQEKFTTSVRPQYYFLILFKNSKYNFIGIADAIKIIGFFSILMSLNSSE